VISGDCAPAQTTNTLSNQQVRFKRLAFPDGLIGFVIRAIPPVPTFRARFPISRWAVGKGPAQHGY
jgi:hypothetical protein